MDIYKDTMYLIELFGKNTLYAERPIPREEVPDRWYSYDLCGTEQKPDKTCTRAEIVTFLYRNWAN